MRRFSLIQTEWGLAGIVGSSGGLRRVLLPGLSKSELIEAILQADPGARLEEGVWPELQEAIRKYFEGRRVAFRVRLDLGDRSAFFALVYRACRKVGYGQVISYGQLARAVGRPGAGRAVGAAMRRNPVPLVVPCHRVIGADGGLAGFSAWGGVAMKRRMLELEGVVLRGGRVQADAQGRTKRAD
jgi:methylated-DNA-[protein]-cysteine S-methyltransferase